MKKLLFLPFILLAFVVKAQLPVTRSPTGVTVEDYRLYPILNFRIPPFADTTEANLSKGLDSLGTVINIRGTPRVYVRQISSGTVKKWGLVGDTTSIFVTQIGTGSPQIPLLYAVDGNLRSARLVPGVFTTPAMNLDSGVHVDLDTTGVGGAAYKQWIINNYGPGVGGNIYTIDGILMTDRHVSGSSTHSLFFDSLAEFQVTSSNGSTPFLTAWPSVNYAALGDYTQATSLPYIDVSGGDSSINIVAKGVATMHALKGFSVQWNNIISGTYKLWTRADVLADRNIYFPYTANTNDTLATLSDVRAGSGGGGIAVDAVQTYTTGTTLTQTTGDNIIQLNPASVQATLTITTATSANWHNSNDLYIVAGGTVTSGNPVITTLAIAAGAGLTLVQSATPTTINAGEVIRYHRIGTLVYRMN